MVHCTKELLPLVRSKGSVRWQLGLVLWGNERKIAVDVLVEVRE